MAENSEKVSISFPKPMLEDARRRIGKQPLSKYLQSLVERDLRHEPIDAMSDDVMIELTLRLHGERDVVKLKPLLEGLVQRDELADLLKSYITSRSEKSKPAHARRGGIPS